MKRLIVSLLLFLFALNIKAQNMDALFIKMPDEIVVQLEEAWRKDLVDLYRSGKTATLENTMQGKSTLLKLTDDYLLLQISERSTLEIKRLSLVNNTYVICVVTTASAPVADSNVKFYTTDWQPLKSISMFEPVTSSWFLKDDVDTTSFGYVDAKALLTIDLIRYKLSPDNTNLTAEYMTPESLDSKDKEKVLPFLKSSPKTYEWKYGRFE